MNLEYEELKEKIIEAAIESNKKLGAGFLESIYKKSNLFTPLFVDMR